jgi:hypothetical protein
MGAAAEHVKVYMTLPAVLADTTVCEPEVLMLPLQALLALQAAALLLDHVSVTAEPADTVVGAIDRLTVGVGDAAE